MQFSIEVSILIGIIVGIGVVGTSVARTLHVNEGEYFKATIQSTFNSFFYFSSVYFIAKNNYYAFGGTVIGAGLIVFIMAYYKSTVLKKRETNEQK